MMVLIPAACTVVASGYGTAADLQSKATPANTVERHKLVLQVSDNDHAKWTLTLANAKNVQFYLGAKNVDIEIVAYGPGINMIKLESLVGAGVSDAIAAGVRVVACESTMTVQKLTKGDMLPSLLYVPAGVVELMARQRQGYVYIRP
jgi:intracellular sulfur oxidation DsrE/DsrF family protein